MGAGNAIALILFLLITTAFITVYFLKKYSSNTLYPLPIFFIVIISAPLSIIGGPILEFLPYAFASDFVINSFDFGPFISPIVIAIITIILATMRSPVSFILIGTLFSFGLFMGYSGLAENFKSIEALIALLVGLIGFSLNITGFWGIMAKIKNKH